MHISRVLSLLVFSFPVLSPANSSHFSIQRRSLSPQIIEIAVFYLVSSPGAAVYKVLPNKVQVIIGLTSFVSLSSGITALCCLFSHI